MHRQPQEKLLPLATELEGTLRNLKKVRVAKAIARVEQKGIDQHVPAVSTIERPQRQRTMEYFWRLVIIYDYLIVKQPPIQENTFELKPALITMVYWLQFTGYPSKDPNERLRRFLRIKNTIKLNGVNPDVIKLQLFPFSLRYIATSWFESLPYELGDNWEELVEAFMKRLFLPTLNSKRRRDVTPRFSV